MDYYKGVIPIYEDIPAHRDLLFPRGVGFGLVPRDYSVDPLEMFDSAESMSVIDESEWDARYDEQEATQSSLEHLYLTSGPNGSPAFVNLDQGQTSYCWNHSTGHALMFNRLVQNEPVLRLNPVAVGAILKRGRNEGGWCGQSAQWASEYGYPVAGNGPGQWPGWSLDLSHDTPELRAAMKLHRTEEQYVDLTRPVYGRNLTRKQFASCLLTNIPVPSDWNPWGHSVCSIRWVRVERGRWRPLIINSWLGWGRHGLAVIEYNGGTPDGAVALRTTTPSVS